MQMSYWRFAAMIATSTVVMFGLMYLHTYAIEHVAWSETRAWMALLMGAAMAIIMLGFMLNMYKKRRVNIAIFAGAAAVFALSLWLVRSQATINEVDYMRAMVPHHSIAVLTSERAQIDDPRVRKLADEIIAAQRREIAEMRYLVKDITAGGGEVDAVDEPRVAPRVVPPDDAIRSAKIAEVDLAELDEAEIERVLGARPRCGFHYSKAAGPVAAASVDGPGGAGIGVIKLHGQLVKLQASAAEPARPGTGRLALRAPGIAVGIAAEGDESRAMPSGAGEWREATAVLQLEAGLKVGYAGYYRCLGPERTQVAGRRPPG